MRSLLLAAASGLALAACSQPADTSADTETAASETNTSQTQETAMSAEAETSNPLVAEWSGPYGGVPAFDQMDLNHLREALEIGMERSRAEINEIANNPEPPTFENTIVAMERAGALARNSPPALWVYVALAAAQALALLFAGVLGAPGPDASEADASAWYLSAGVAGGWAVVGAAGAAIAHRIERHVAAGRSTRKRK